ncbi:MAG: hypothetical protein JNL14_14300 [Devosia sp.]|uniref:hypothetical protein n=1 Tax=Devosia sp. TaxID=1871048 RepID=UPI001A4B19C3|nr:hypothetical protein [Devosia sp.]MBL8598902.1 hypothetical protein [Devosia sp.]
MQRDTISASLREIAFDFFYWFSRFEFALKENGYLRNRKEGAAAEPGWDEFIKAHEGDYALTSAAKALIAEEPQRQTIDAHEQPEFRAVDITAGASDLRIAARYARCATIFSTAANMGWRVGTTLRGWRPF